MMKFHHLRKQRRARWLRLAGQCENKVYVHSSKKPPH